MENGIVRLGIIGMGGIANGAHLRGLGNASNVKITAICDIDENKLKACGDKLGIDPDKRFADYRDLIACDEVDAVEVCTPNNLHAEMAIAVLEAGKPLELEKPMGLCVDEALAIKAAEEKSGTFGMMCFSYRFMSAVRYAKYLIDKGSIGRILGINVEYLKSSALWEGRRLEWRFRKELAGTGVLGDLGVHLIDMARLLAGEFTSVSCDRKVIVKRRQMPDSDEWGDVTTDDICNFTAEINGEIPVSFAISRCCHGHSNTIKYDIFGDAGVISFDLNNPDILRVCIGEADINGDGLHTVKVPPKFRASQEQTFIDACLGKRGEYFPTVDDGVVSQKILDALCLSSDEGRRVYIEY